MSLGERPENSSRPFPLPVVPIVLVLLLLGFALFGEKGVLRALQASRQKALLEEEVRRLEAANAQLRSEIEALRSDRRYIEAVARKELGMVKDDELIYQFRSTQQEPRPTGKGSSAEGGDAPPAKER